MASAFLCVSTTDGGTLQAMPIAATDAGPTPVQSTAVSRGALPQDQQLVMLRCQGFHPRHRLARTGRLSVHEARCRGFVLLYTLVLLLAMATLFLGIQSLSKQQAHATAAQLRSMTKNIQLESAAHELSFRLLQLAALPAEDAQMVLRALTIDGVEATVVPIDALLDLNSAAREHILSLLRAAGAANAATATDQLLRQRPIQTFAALSGLGLSDTVTQCVMRFATLSSGQPLPSRADTDPRLLRMLALSSPGEQARTVSIAARSPVTSYATLAGRGFRYWLRHAGAESIGSDLVVEVRMTGRTDQPIHVLEWIWVPRLNSRPC